MIYIYIVFFGGEGGHYFNVLVEMCSSPQNFSYLSSPRMQTGLKSIRKKGHIRKRDGGRGDYSLLSANLDTKKLIICIFFIVLWKGDSNFPFFLRVL